MLKVLEESAVAGTYWWGKHDAKTRRKKDRSEWLPLKVEPIVDPALFELARRLRSKREPMRNPGRAPSPEMLLRGLIRCGKCGSSYTLGSSGKKACAGGRVPAVKLDNAVLEFIVGVVCTGDRCAALLASHNGGTPGAITDEAFDSVHEAWSTMIRSDPSIARNYLPIWSGKSRSMRIGSPWFRRRRTEGWRETKKKTRR